MPRSLAIAGAMRALFSHYDENRKPGIILGADAVSQPMAISRE
jgi:hypothetical protein